MIPFSIKSINYNGVDIYLFEGSTLGFSSITSHIPSLNATVTSIFNEKKDDTSCFALVSLYWDMLLNTTTAIDNNKIQTDFIVFPNPTSNVINITSERINEITRIEILDISGNIAKNIAPNNSSNLAIDISDLQQGMYLINIYSEKGNSIKKVIKK